MNPACARILATAGTPRRTGNRSSVESLLARPKSMPSTPPWSAAFAPNSLRAVRTTRHRDESNPRDHSGREHRPGRTVGTTHRGQYRAERGNPEGATELSGCADQATRGACRSGGCAGHDETGHRDDHHRQRHSREQHRADQHPQGCVDEDRSGDGCRTRDRRDLPENCGQLRATRCDDATRRGSRGRRCVDPTNTARRPRRSSGSVPTLRPTTAPPPRR